MKTMNPILEAYKKYRPQMVEVGRAIFIVDPKVEAARLEYSKELMEAWGRAYSAGEFPDWVTQAPLGTRCYDNAMQLIAQRSDLIYVEGFLWGIEDKEVITVMGHAWCATTDGEVIDPTRGVFQKMEELAYTGIPIRAEYSESWKQLRGNYGVLDGTPEGDKTVGIYADPPELWLDQR